MPLAAMASAAPAAGSEGTVIALTPEQKAAVLANGTEEAVDASLARAENGGASPRGIHGEMGMTVGTRNTRGIYGNAVIPLGRGATVAISFDHYQTDPGQFRWRRGGWYVPDANAP
jgi:hypothetical protein